MYSQTPADEPQCGIDTTPSNDRYQDEPLQGHQGRLFKDLIEEMSEHDWHELDFKSRYILIEDFTEDLYEKFGEDGYIAKIGYDIDDCQFLVWRAYEKALETGKVRLGLL